MLDRVKTLESSNLRRNLQGFLPEDIHTTIITFEEQMRGWLSFIARSKTSDQQVYAYQRLHHFLEVYRTSLVLDFDEKAADEFVRLKALKIRIGTMDLKIAAIAISNNAILISRNLKDFEQVPNLTVQDWT